MLTLRKLTSSLDPMALLLSAAGAAVLAWLVRDKITPYLLGTSFAERCLAVKAVLLAALALGFFIYIASVQIINRRLDDHSRLKPRAFLAVAGGLTGAFTFLFIFGPGTLDGTRVDWLMDLGDNAMHYLGWVFFRHDPWSFPLTTSQSLSYPYGISVSLTDPVTLLILPFKLLRSILPEPFQYFGLWTLACFILQGAFSALIVIETTKNRMAALLAPLFFCTANILIYRVYTYIPHVGQWTILAALYLFFLNRRTQKYNGWWPAVLCAGLLVQPYLVGIIFVLFLGAMLERFLLEKDWRGPLVSLVISLASIALVMWITGMSGGDYTMSGPGVDYFKTNLNSLVNPVNAGWSVFLPPLLLAPGTYPNVHYLGLGMILLAVFALIAYLIINRGSLARILKANFVLIAMVLVLTILSLGNVVTLNEKILFTYSLPEPLMKVWSIFKATERFLWPVTYLIFIFAISQAVNLLRGRRLAALALLLAITIQYADAAPLLREKYETWHDPRGSHSPLKSDFWQDAGKQYRHLVMLPLNLRNWARLTEFAANNGLTTNYFYFGRETGEISAGAEEKIRQLEAGRAGESELYVLTDSSTVKAACKLIRSGTPFAYVDGEFVLAPAFEGNLNAYPDVAVTGENFECGAVTLADFLERYRDKLIVISVMEDGAGTMDVAGFSVDLREQAGKSYIGIAHDGKLLFEQLSDGRIDFEAAAGEMVNGVELPVDLRVSSAGRISGEEISEIIVAGKDYSFGRRGMNVSVYDPMSGEVIDNALFEMRDGVMNY
ncbi:MAG: DUF6311 domain-containing protein [Anaerolineaceae bacterium]